MRLNSHKRPIPGVLPPEKYILDHCIFGQGGHVFWSTTRKQHSHDAKGQAVLHWHTKPSVTTRMVSRGIYNVVRVLFEHRGLPTDHVRNRCGLSECLNLAHWGVAETSPYTILAPARRPWRLVDGKTGLDWAGPPPVVNVHSAGVTHLAQLAPPAPLRAVCGAVLDPAVTIVVTTPRTCKAGC